MSNHGLLMLLRRSNVRETNSSFRRTSRNVIEKTCRPPSLYRCTSKSTFSDLLLFPDISLSRLYTLSLSFSASDIQFPFIRNFSRRTDKTREGFVISKPVVRGDCFFSFLPFFLFYLRAFFFEKLPLLFSLLARVLLLLLLLLASPRFEPNLFSTRQPDGAKSKKRWTEQRAITGYSSVIFDVTTPCLLFLVYILRIYHLDPFLRIREAWIPICSNGN